MILSFSGKKLAGIVLLAGLVLGAGLFHSQPASASPLPSPALFANTKADNCDKSGFFGLEPWYHFMPDSEIGVNTIVSGSASVPSDPCGIKCFNIFVQTAPNECGETASDIPGVVLAILDDLLRVAAIVAVAFILVGSFQFVGSRGNSERTANAQSTIINALTGLAVALIATTLINYLGNQLH